MTRFTLLLACFLIGSCRPDDLLTPDIPRAGFSVSDGAHGDGNPHFFFLPPLAPDPAFAGAFDASLAPVVEICEWDGSACTYPPVATFTADGSPGSEAVRVVPEDEHYVVNWHSARSNVRAKTLYRIRVVIADTELGHIDVTLSDRGMRQRGRAGHQGLDRFTIGSTIPVKFRIERGAVFLAGPAGGVIENVEHTVRLEVPPAALENEVAFTILPATNPPDDPWLVRSAAFRLGPDGLPFSDAARLTIHYEERDIPGDIAESDLALHRVVATSWELVDESTVNTEDHAVSGETLHLSTYAPLGVLTITAPVAGPYRITRAENPECEHSERPDLWTFCQHRTDLHAPDGGIAGADETLAWDMNLLDDADEGEPVFAVASGTVVKWAGVHEAGAVSGSVLIEHSSGGATWWSGYLHMRDIEVAEGQAVDPSTRLGRISNIISSPRSIPNHLHFAVYVGANEPDGLRSRDAKFVERAPVAPSDYSLVWESQSQFSIGPGVCNPAFEYFADGLMAFAEVLSGSNCAQYTKATFRIVPASGDGTPEQLTVQVTVAHSKTGTADGCSSIGTITPWVTLLEKCGTASNGTYGLQLMTNTRYRTETNAAGFEDGASYRSSLTIVLPGG